MGRKNGSNPLYFAEYIMYRLHNISCIIHAVEMLPVQKSITDIDCKTVCIVEIDIDHDKVYIKNETSIR